MRQQLILQGLCQSGEFRVKGFVEKDGPSHERIMDLNPYSVKIIDWQDFAGAKSIWDHVDRFTRFFAPFRRISAARALCNLCARLGGRCRSPRVHLDPCPDRSL
jgi:hypothetical protein